MKAWQVLVLAVSILGAGGLVASAIWSQERYHYCNLPVDGRLARINRFTGEVQVYYGDSGWVISAAPMNRHDAPDPAAATSARRFFARHPAADRLT